MLDLPAPLGPSRAVTSPAAISIDTLRTTARPPRRTVRSRRLSSLAGADPSRDAPADDGSADAAPAEDAPADDGPVDEPSTGSGSVLNRPPRSRDRPGSRARRAGP